jgi:hypothetical protein
LKTTAPYLIAPNVNSEQSRDLKEQPKPLLGNRLNIEQLAVVLNPADPPCERSVYNLLDDLGVPYVKVLNVRWYDPDVVRAAILAREVSWHPPKRGRPARRKAA